MIFSHIFSEVTTSPTLWAGTNSGQILAFILTFSKNEDKRKEDKVEVSVIQKCNKPHMSKKENFFGRFWFYG